MTYKTSTCQPMTATLGDSCGFGEPACEEEFACAWVLPEALGCIEFSQEGQPCGLGVGTCADGLSCWPDAIENETGMFCYAPKALGEVCAWGAGNCDEGLACMWDEDVDLDNIPHCYPATLEEGEVCGNGTGSCGPWLACNLDPATDTQVCLPIAIPGDDCGDGIATCASSISSCTLLTPDGEDAMCMALKWPGDTCGYGVGACLSGLDCTPSIEDPTLGVCEDICEVDGLYGDGTCDTDCWAPDSDCFCIPDCDGKSCGGDGCGGTCGDGCIDGEFCDGGMCKLASCVDDAAVCGVDSTCVVAADFTDLVCMDDAAEGEPCLFGNADCAEGLMCMQLSPGVMDYTCVASTAALGEACAFGEPMCAQGGQCQWIGFEQTACVAELALGDDCLAEGAGPCPEGSACMWTSEAEEAAVCMASDQEPGEPCYWGLGLCVEGSTCQYNETGTEVLCYANDLEEGEACGGVGQGDCAEPLLCTPSDPSSDAGVCLPSAFVGEPCGYGIAFCQLGMSCLAASPEADNAVCTVNVDIGESCGDGLAGCHVGLSCITDGDNVSTCSDPCEFYGYYGDGQCDEGCLVFDADDCL